MNSDTVLPARVWFRTLRLMAQAQLEVGTRLKSIGLSIPQFDVLSTLTEQEGLSQRALADRLYVTKGNVSGLLDRLEQAGLVERRDTPGDRRSHGVYLTEKGRMAALKGLKIQTAFIVQTLGTLKGADLSEMDRLTRNWRDIVRNLPAEKPLDAKAG